VIRIENLYKVYGDREVISDFNAVLDKGINNLIIGASGSGKTTITKCVVGLTEPTKGRVLFDDVDFFSLGRKDRAEMRQLIGFMFQGGALFDSMSVEENVMFALRVFTNRSYAEMKKRVDFCLDRVGLSGVNNLMPDELSGGMVKRVAIARAIVMNPSYLFCDEPNSGLDPQTAILIDELISEITHEYQITTVIITHDMNSVMDIGDHVIFLHQGQKWWEGSKKEILDAKNEQLREFIYASSFMKSLKDLQE
jgi:phospholipid/cholesterol/gamma-HCH transport system ATP-binding protein